MAEEAVEPLGGTRHTSGRRYSYDDPLATVVAVSETVRSLCCATARCSACPTPSDLAVRDNAHSAA
jgi:hypothetical protein